MLAAAAVLAALAIAPPAAAQPADSAAQAAERSRSPCRFDADARRFDFWIGEWDVKTTSGQTAGRNSVHPVSGGCGLLENWISATGDSGKSLNAYNRPLRRWQQFWVGHRGAVTEYRDSRWENGSLRFVATTPAPGGAATLQRMTFTPVSADVVRQHGESSADGGKTWTTTFDLYYHRRR
jgi:hypothetical protein